MKSQNKTLLPSVTISRGLLCLLEEEKKTYKRRRGEIPTLVLLETAAAEAEVRKYQVMLVRAACAWVIAKAYQAGDIIIYNGHVFRALVDNVATADNDPGDMDGTWEFLGLEEDAAPLAIDGYFPLYETEEAANAAGNGSSHTHTIDGVTYYMPDAGVTIYHGNYTGFDY